MFHPLKLDALQARSWLVQPMQIVCRLRWDLGSLTRVCVNVPTKYRKEGADLKNANIHMEFNGKCEVLLSLDCIASENR